MTRTVIEKEIDDLIASGVRLRFTGKVFEFAHTPGKGKRYKLQDVMLRVRAGRAWLTTEYTEGVYHELVVTRPPRRGEAVHM